MAGLGHAAGGLRGAGRISGGDHYPDDWQGAGNGPALGDGCGGAGGRGVVFPGTLGGRESGGGNAVGAPPRGGRVAAVWGDAGAGRCFIHVGAFGSAASGVDGGDGGFG